MAWPITIKRFQGGLLLGALSILGSSCSSLLYQPTRLLYYDPAQLGVSARNVWIRSEDDQTFLHGWYLAARPDQPPRALIVFFHGNAENLTSHYAALAWILKEGFDYLIFDYQGYGLSAGHPSPEGTVHDGKSVLRWAHQQYPRTPLIVFGQSLGGAVALRAVAELNHEVPLRLVAVDSTFASYRKAARSVLSRHWLTWPFQPLACLTLSDEWAPEDTISRISPTPLLVLHGDHDQVVNYELGQEVFDLAKEPKEFWRIEGGEHTDSFWRHGGRYRAMFLAKLKALGL